MGDCQVEEGENLFHFPALGSSSRDSTCKYLINILFIYYTSLYALIMQNKSLEVACCRQKNLQGLKLAKNIHERTGNE